MGAIVERHALDFEVATHDFVKHPPGAGAAGGGVVVEFEVVDGHARLSNVSSRTSDGDRSDAGSMIVHKVCNEISEYWTRLLTTFGYYPAFQRAAGSLPAKIHSPSLLVSAVNLGPPRVPRFSLRLRYDERLQTTS